MCINLDALMELHKTAAFAANVKRCLLDDRR